MLLSRGALLWLCKRLREASESRGETFKTWRCRDISTYIYCSLKFNKHGQFISVITVNGQSRSVIIIPENTFNEGWGSLVTRVENFIERNVEKKGEFITKSELNLNTIAGKGDYKGALHNIKWSKREMNVASENSMLTVSSDVDDSNLLRSCLVGRFCGEGDMPIRNEVRRWAQQTWKGAHNVQVYDMSGFLFLFKFQTRTMAELVIMGEWKRQGLTLKLEWWSPTVGAFPDEKRFDWFWIRVLGLPLQLWNNKVMEKIGDECGGWLETEEETEIKNHLRWARIRVRGPREKIPTKIEIVDNGLIYSLPVWVESPATYRLMEVEKRADRGDSDILLDGTKDRPMLLEDRNRVLERGKGPATKKTTYIEVYKEWVQEKDNSHLASGSGTPEHTLNLNKTQAHLTQLLGLSSKPKTAMFTEPLISSTQIGEKQNILLSTI
ncbi:hypothetical protein H5410_030352 [Solanum commersonii]|uniref:DUF4283 domain-containing protein n=1 Tax=Solanum commersonii TaxID=4109 RepID=A0A9J5YJ36_SOLCO|nr:hypothetical protein H5410_030352 [Solanum commersonii]